MSDTAISSQIVSEVSPTAGGSTSPLSENEVVAKTQASEFDDVLAKNIDSSDALAADILLQPQLFSELPDQELLNLNPLLSTNPLLDSQLKSSLGPLNTATMDGKLLPAQLPVNDLMLKNTNPLVAQTMPTQTMPLDGKFDSSITMINPSVTNNGLFGATELPLEDGLLAGQMSTTFTEKNIPDFKQLNAQFLNQFLTQTQTKQKPLLDTTVLAAATPGIIMNQSLSVNSSEAVLPAITVSPESAQWNSQVGDRINWMVTNNMQRVEIRLDPPELGNLDIRLNMAKDNQASIMVHVTNATAKEAIESAIPRLREMFEQQGLNLADVDVSQQNFQQQQSAFEQFENNDSEHNGLNLNSLSESEDSDEQILAVTKLNSSSDNLLDIFA